MWRRNNGFVLIAAYASVSLLTALLAVYMTRALQEGTSAQLHQNRAEAFYLAEGGLQQAIRTIGQNSSLSNTQLASLVNGSSTLGTGSFQVQITVGPDASSRTVVSTGTSAQRSRTVQAVVQSTSWAKKIPAAVYSHGNIKLKFDTREEGDDAYIAGYEKPGVYGTDDVTSKREGEGRISGTPPIVENQEVPEGLEDGIWEAFDLNTLRDVAKANGTYFAADDSTDEFNNPFNKKGKYTLPVNPGETSGVFFFDAKNGEPLDDDEVDPKNRVKVKLEGTSEPMNGVIVVVGELKIRDTRDYDFLFDGVIIVLDELEIDDRQSHRREGTNDSDVVIRGAVLSDNILKKAEKRKKKTSLELENSTVEYNAAAINAASATAGISPRWEIIPGTWQETYN